jgi:hypothetical protein
MFDNFIFALISYRGTKFLVSAGGVMKDVKESFEQIKETTNATMHADYDPYFIINDIGLVFFQTGFSLSTNITVHFIF